MMPVDWVRIFSSKTKTLVGEVEVKGMAEPVTMLRAVRTRQMASRPV